MMYEAASLFLHRFFCYILIRYQIVVNHANWINSVTPGAHANVMLALIYFDSTKSGFPGCINDKTGVRYDEYIAKMRTDPVFTGYEFPLYDSRGRTITGRGAYAIADGGYHLWKVSQGPAPDAPSLQERAFSKVVVENRKDSEVTIGRLRHRFRVLRMPFLCKRREQIDATVHTAAILHNMLLKYDGHAVRFDDMNPAFELNDVQRDDDVEEGWRAVRVQGVEIGPLDEYGGRGLQLHRGIGQELEPGYNEFREKLVRHVHYLTLYGELQHRH